MSPSEGIAEHVRNIEEKGYSILENAIEPDFVEALREELSKLERALDIETGKNPFEGSRTWRIYNLLVHGKLFERIPVHPRVLPVVERVLDAGCLISSLSSIAIGPDEVPQPPGPK